MNGPDLSREATGCARCSISPTHLYRSWREVSSFPQYPNSSRRSSDTITTILVAAMISSAVALEIELCGMPARGQIQRPDMDAGEDAREIRGVEINDYAPALNEFCESQRTIAEMLHELQARRCPWRITNSPHKHRRNDCCNSF
jgi:hypothetical protein